MNTTFGTLEVMLDGKPVLITGSFTANLGTVKSEAVVGLDGHVAFKEAPRSAWIKGQARDHDGLDVKQMLSLSDVTVTAIFPNGKSWVFRNATQTGEGDLSVDDGAIEIMFNAISAEEL